MVSAEKPTVAAVMASLWVAEGPDRGKAIVLLDGQSALIGRAGHCDLALSEQQVSKEHFKLERDAGGYVLQDLKSTVGTVGQRRARRASGAP